MNSRHRVHPITCSEHKMTPGRAVTIYSLKHTENMTTHSLLHHEGGNSESCLFLGHLSSILQRGSGGSHHSVQCKGRRHPSGNYPGEGWAAWTRWCLSTECNIHRSLNSSRCLVVIYMFYESLMIVCTQHDSTQNTLYHQPTNLTLVSLRLMTEE